MDKVMKLSALICALGFGHAAMADDASQTFQWAGSLPVANTGGTTTIENVGSTDFASGSMQFAETVMPGEYKIKSASQMIFDVYEGGSSATSFDYTLTNFDFSVAGGFTAPVADEFILKANGNDLLPQTPVTSAAGTVALDLVSDQAITGNGNDAVLVTAAILIENSA